VSVQTVELLWEGWRDRDGFDRKREYVRTYEVLTDNKDDTVETAAGQEARDKGLPGNGYTLDTDPAAVVVDIQTARDTPRRWLVTCVYNTVWPSQLGAESLTLDPFGGSIPTPTAPGSGGAGGAPPAAQRDPNPVNWPIVYSVTHEQTSVPATHDKDGVPITNSAGDPFNPPVMVEKSMPVLTFTKYYAFVDIDWLESYVDTVNAVSWKGRTSRICRMIALDWNSETVNNFPVWKVTFRVKIKRGTWAGVLPNDVGRGWDLRILDQGYQEYVNILAGDEKRKIDPPRGDHGGEMPGPYPLDGLGQSAFGATKPSYVTKRHFQEADWSVLGL
jgi:hypothetical protein